MGTVLKNIKVAATSDIILKLISNARQCKKMSVLGPASADRETESVEILQRILRTLA